MAVHNLQAESLVVTTWLPIDTFPRDGTVVEVLCADDEVRLAQWNFNIGSIMVDSTSIEDMTKDPGGLKLKSWRNV
jgi:hypothetical protein